MADDQKRLQGLSDDLQKAQDDLQTTIDTRQRLESQQQENKAVMKEFDGLSEDSKVFKMVGPVLLKQEKAEALGAVNGRLEFISKQIIDTENRIKDLQDGSDKTRTELLQLQQKMQSAAQGQATA